MFDSHFKIAYNQFVDGIDLKVVHRENEMIMSEMNIKKDCILPEHVHQSNHSAYLLQGKIRVIVDGISSEFVQGDSWCMERNICHSTKALEDSTILEVFNPDGETEGFQNQQSVLGLRVRL